MSDGMILTQVPEMVFQAAVSDALKLYREGDWLKLADVLLAHTPLVEACFLEGEVVGHAERARIMAAMLHWAVDKLSPGGEPNWLASSWRHYHVLAGYYLEGRRVAELAEQLAIVEQTFYSWRTTALQAVSRVIFQELLTPQDLNGRCRYALKARYNHYTSREQKLLRWLSIFAPGEFVPQIWLEQFLPAENWAEEVQHLRLMGVILANEPATAVALHPGLHAFISLLLPANEKKTWHQLAAQQAQQRQEYLAAACHWQWAGDFVALAQTLITYRQAIFDANQADGLRALLIAFPFAELNTLPTLQAQLKIVAGKVAEYVQNMEAAIADYGEALGAPDLPTKAQAYYLRAKALQRHNVDESLAHFEYGIELVATAVEPDLLSLHVNMIIDRAWIFIQERPDPVRATADLAQAEAIIPPQDRALWADLYNAQAGLAYQKKNLQEALSYRLKAWVAASETQDLERMTKMAYNLGQAYLWLQEYAPGLDYLKKSSDLAQKAGNLQMQGLSHKGMGSCYFLQGQMGNAIVHYQMAYVLWDKTKNANWRSVICYDLAEAYATLGDLATARRYFNEGQALAAELGASRTVAAFTALATQHPGLVLALNERQQLALGEAQKTGAITKQAYAALTAVSPSQAHRDLQALCEMGLLQMQGKGRATQYILEKQPS